MTDTQKRVQHTSGPWHTGEGYKTAKDHAIYAGPCLVATADGYGYPIGRGWSPRSEANARLIAAAPDLLEALKFAAARIELANAEGDPILSAWLPDARAVIAKAEGR